MAQTERIPIPEAIRRLNELDPHTAGAAATAAQILRRVVPPPVSAAYEDFIERLYAPPGEAPVPYWPVNAAEQGTADTPVIADREMLSQEQFSALKHVHDAEGACIRNRFGARCSS